MLFKSMIMLRKGSMVLRRKSLCHNMLARFEKKWSKRCISSSSSSNNNTSMHTNSNSNTNTNTNTRKNKKHELVDYNNFLTNLSKSRKPSAVREIMPFFRIPGMISLAAGTPNPSAFPFRGISFGVPKNPSSYDATNIDDFDEIALSPQELDMALQYSPSNGLSPFVNILKEWHFREHSPPYASDGNDENNFDLIVSTGSQDLLTRVMNEMIDFDTDMLHRDSIIIEAPCYSGTLAYLKPYYDSGKVNVKEVEMDGEGMIPSLLEDSIESVLKETGKTPKLLYLIPIGQNPSGISYSYQRKKIIYDIACKYNIIILEDDPYYALQFNSIEKAPLTFDQFNNNFEMNQNNQEYKYYNKSFQSMDYQGRVIRCDSFSKVMSSGMRLGYASGPKKIINQLILNAQATHLHTSGISQMLCYKLFEYWGYEKYVKHCRNVAYTYYKQRDLMEEYLIKYLKNDDKLKSHVEWNIPIAGMFYWLNLKDCYDCDDGSKINDTQILIKEKALKHKVLMLPGKSFYMRGAKAYNCTNVRVGFSIATSEQMDEGIKRFRNLLL